LHASRSRKIALPSSRFFGRPRRLPLARAFLSPALTRSTFAVELLLAGVPMERVGMLLGHQNVRITEKHYNPWVWSRQEQLEANVQRTWARDPLALLETKGTPEVYGKHEALN
jgi:integrase